MIWSGDASWVVELATVKYSTPEIMAPMSCELGYAHLSSLERLSSVQDRNIWPHDFRGQNFLQILCVWDAQQQGNYLATVSAPNVLLRLLLPSFLQP